MQMSMILGLEFKFNYNFTWRKLTSVCNLPCPFKRYYYKRFLPSCCKM